MIKYFLFKLIHRLVLILPIKWSYWIGCRVADIDHLFKRKLRKAVKSNLCHIFMEVCPGNVTKSFISAQTKAVFRNFAKYLVDFFSFARLDSNNIDRFVKVKGIEHIQAAFNRGKGVIGLTAHIGNWELGGAVVSLLGFRVNAVALSHENTKINRLFTNQRVSKGVNVIPVGAGAGRYLNVLRQNQMIALVGDRMTSDAGIEVDFFNKPTLVPKGPAVLSLRTGALVVPSFVIRNPDDTFDMIFEEPIDPNDFLNNNSCGIKEMTKKMVSVLEGYISKYPSQWFLFYKVWNEK